MRLRTRELARLEVHPMTDLDAKSREKVESGFEALERMLADGRQWLGGGGPDLSDVAVWPVLARLEEAGHRIPDRLRRATAYWSHARERESLTSTRPR